jgi:hypothetical protein
VEKTDNAGLTGQAGVELLIHSESYHETMILSIGIFMVSEYENFSRLS